jgi:hypothetical protein
MKQHRTAHNLTSLLTLAILFSLSGCSYMKYIDPHLIASEIPSEPPAPKITEFDQALRDLGKMTQIYDTYSIAIQSIVVGDETGIALAREAEGEIPQRISEMTNSALNAVGGKVVFIPYIPNYINSMHTIGYPSAGKKILPNVILSGGITEFDRGLEIRGKNTDMGFSTKSISGAPTWFDSQTISLDSSLAEKTSVATITLDSNLLDFQTVSGIPGIQAVNTIKVYKTNSEKELSFSLFGPSFGLKGTIQKVQGRHAAVRLLVQLNTIEVIGKLYNLPYWKLLPNFATNDLIVAELRTDFRKWSEVTRTIKFQEMLYLHGQNVPVSGVFDERTRQALQLFAPAAAGKNILPDAELFVQLYTSIPITNETVTRRHEFNGKLQALLKQLKQRPGTTEKS